MCLTNFKRYAVIHILQASRASFYILIVSAIFGVIPGGINGCAQKIQSDVSSVINQIIV